MIEMVEILWFCLWWMISRFPRIFALRASWVYLLAGLRLQQFFPCHGPVWPSGSYLEFTGSILILNSGGSGHAEHVEKKKSVNQSCLSPSVCLLNPDCFYSCAFWLSPASTDRRRRLRKEFTILSSPWFLYHSANPGEDYYGKYLIFFLPVLSYILPLLHNSLGKHPHSSVS